MSAPAPPAPPDPAPRLPAPLARHRIPPPRLYLYFDAIVRYGSIRSAADALRIASSALNRRLLDLEQEVGATLFDRLQTGVRLTRAGEMFASHVRRTLSDAASVGEQIEALQGSIGGHVAIGSAESAAVDFLPPTIAAFQCENPGVRVTLAVSTPRALLNDLLDDRVDLILTHEEPVHADAVILAMAEKPFCALMRLDHPLATRSRLFMHECQDYPLVLAEETLAARALVEMTLATSAIQIKPALTTNMFEVMKHYVRLTDAISFQFHFGPLAGDTLEGLAAIPLADPQLAQAHLTLAVRRGRALPAGADALCERLRILLTTTAML